MKLIHRTERGRSRSREVLETRTQKELPFDPERDITAEDCSRIKQSIEKEVQFNNTTMNWMFCSLFPDQVDSLQEKKRIRAYHSQDAKDYADELTTLKVLRPKEFKQKDYTKTTLHQDLTAALANELRARSANKWDHWVNVAICFKSLFPADQSLQLSTEQLAEVRKGIDWDNRSHRHFHLWELAKFKLLFPEQFSDLQMEPEDWGEVKRRIKELRENPRSIYGLTYTLFSAKILAAEQAGIDSDGNVVITPPARPLSIPQPLPSRDLSA